MDYLTLSFRSLHVDFYSCKPVMYGWIVRCLDGCKSHVLNCQYMQLVDN